MDRTAYVDLMQKRYAAVHQAMPHINYAELRGETCGGKVCAALGYRRADVAPLFLEAYLDVPVEQTLQVRLGRSVERHNIVEIGNLASCNAPAMIALWARTANDLGSDAEVAVAVLTAPLRRMFARLGVPLIELASANRDRIVGAALEWGQYYQNDPMVCAGLIADGQARLARYSARIERRAA
jgi:hypothetical protein